MLKPVTKLLAVSSVLAVAAGVSSGPASAATTRSEYIAQADPICQQFVDPESTAYSAFRRDMKRWVHACTTLATAAASALNRFQLNRFDRLARRADNAEAAGLKAINGFGFQVCGVYV
jgi:hypothetical protein